MASPDDPIDVDGHVAAGIARAEHGERDPDPDCCDGCRCYFPRVRAYDDGSADDDDLFDGSDCEHCPEHCDCVPCMYAPHA